MNKKSLLAMVLFLNVAYCFGQKKDYKVMCIGFYNLENLFDTINQPEVKDEEFTPTGANLYTPQVYIDKLGKLETVVADIGKDFTPDGFALLGVAEIENESVLQNLVHQPKLKERNLQIVHYNSPDERGIDVGLLYNPKYFKVKSSETIFVPIFNNDSTPRYTRDILYVTGLLDGEPVHVFVNHWPSRRGGEEASAPSRAIAAGVARHKIDSLLALNADSKIILMGDLNDDPISPSLTAVIKAKGDEKEIQRGDIFNPWMSYYKQGIGTLAYNDAWNLFDQIVFSSSFLNKEQKGVFYKEANIYKKEFMIQQSGRYKGYPKRTYDFNKYIGGYSDHFPTYIVLLKEKRK